jgi:hypothetical protein
MATGRSRVENLPNHLHSQLKHDQTSLGKTLNPFTKMTPKIMINRNQIFDKLKSLTEAQFKTVLFLFNAPMYYLPGENTALASKAIELIRYAEQRSQGLQNLDACIEQALAESPATLVHQACAQTHSGSGANIAGNQYNIHVYNTQPETRQPQGNTVMDPISFALSAFSGVAGNAMYASIKRLFGTNAGQLEQLAKNDDRQSFELVVQALLNSNAELKQQLESLQRGENINIVNQTHSGSGDNVVNKYMR